MNYVKPKQKVLPYNTGKVEIGKHYVPPQRCEPVSVDMERLQTALIANRRILNWETIYTGVTVTALVVVIFMDLFIWRP